MKASPGGSAPHRRVSFVDVHCHCLPGLDDGPRSCRETVALCRSLTRDGIGAVVATPHQLGRFGRSAGPDVIRHAVEQVNGALAQEGIDLCIAPGAEVRLDERVSTLLAEDAILTLADRHRHLLLELPEDAFIDIEPLIVELAGLDVDLILAHPERNAPLMAHGQALWRWLNYGVTLQLTAGSLLGYLGRAAAQNAWWLLTKGWAAVIATDAHDPGPAGPCMTAAFAMIQCRLGVSVANLVCSGNPARVLSMERIRSPLFQQRQEVR